MPFELSQTHQIETPQCCEIVVHFEMEGAEEIGVRLHQSGAQETVIGYDVARSILFLERSYSGITDFYEHFVHRCEAPLLCENGMLSLQIFVDACSVEVFAGDGAIYLVGLFFPISRGKGELFIRGKARVAHLGIYPLH